MITYFKRRHRGEEHSLPKATEVHIVGKESSEVQGCSDTGSLLTAIGKMGIFVLTEQDIVNPSTITAASRVVLHGQNSISLNADQRP